MPKEIKKMCPIFKEECLGHECEWFIHVRGTDPQTGKELDMHDCTMRWIPTLLIENSSKQRETGAAIESFRNEMVKGQNATARILLQNIQRDVKLIENDNDDKSDS